MKRYHFLVISLIIILIICVILYINTKELKFLKIKTQTHLSTIHKTIYDIDENNKKIEFDNNKYIFNLYEKNNDFTNLKTRQNKLIKSKYDIDLNKEQKYNMMKSYDSFNL